MQLDEIKEYLPFYLTSDQKIALAKAIDQFPHCNYYSKIGDPDPLQGDGWSGVDVVNFEDGSRKSVRGIVLSNSCDIDPKNSRDLPPKVNFCPIIKLSVVEAQMRKAGLTNEQVTAKLKSIRSQAVTAIFYLPAGGSLVDEHIAPLFDIHSVPLNFFLAKPEKARLFSLSQVGFYIFTMKLSIHFCRMHEQVDRDSATVEH